MSSVVNEYRKYRREHPLVSARYAILHAKAAVKNKEEWEPDLHAYNKYTKKVDNFRVRVAVEDESQCPMENDGLGHYVRGASTDYDYEWNGNYPRPTEELPLGLPYTSFASGAYSQDRNACEYFIPDGVEDWYQYIRKFGQSKSVAWDMTKEWVEENIRDWFGEPLCYASIRVEVYYVTADGEEIEIGNDVIFSSYLGNDDVFGIVSDNNMVENALDEARKHIEEMKEVV